MYSERELVTELKKGNEYAVEVLLERYGDRLLRVALGICGDRQRAEEAVQDAMLQAIRKIHGFQERSSLGTWLFRITVNQARNRIRGSLLRRMIFWDDGKMSILPDTEAEQPEIAFLREETRSEVLHCLQKLPLKYKEVLTLYYLEEFSVEEISRILVEPAGTIKSKMSRGRALLKTMIYGEGGTINNGPV